MRLPLTIATAVVLVVGVVVGVAALGSARAGGAAPLEPITVQAPVGPAPAPDLRLPGQQPPPDPQGYVAPPPPVRDGGEGFGTGDDGPGDDGPDDDD